MASNKDLRENNDLLRQQNELLKQRSGIQENTLDDARDFANIIADQTKQIQFQVSEKRQLRSISSQINKISQESFSLSEKELSSSKGLNSIIKNRESLEKNLLSLNSLKNKIVVEDKELQGEINSNIEKQILSTNKLLKELKEVEDLSSKIEKNFTVKSFGALSDISKSIPGLRKFSEPFKEAEEATRKTTLSNLKANEIKKLGNKIKQEDIKRLGLEGQLLSKNGDLLAGGSAFQKAQSLGLTKTTSTLMSGLKAMGPALTKALGPISLIIELIGAFGRVNKESVELQKSMALSSNEAASFRSNLSTAAKQSGDINVTASKLLKTFSEVNKQFGFITNFASSTLVTMTKLTSVVGVSSEAAGNLAAASTLTGKSFESNYKDVLGTSYELQRQEGVQFDLREILEETGKVTGTVRANLGANPANIAKAITQAKLFGASLQQVASAGKSLLDFESSITSELEAELLLGKDINLERARLAALNGDQVTLAKELRKEAGDYDDFMKMNVLQQEAIAKAMGMQSDELADILFKQDIQGKTAKELRALGKDELADRLEAQTVQDKFNASVEKLKEIFADVATALMPVFEFLGMIFNLVGKIVKFLEPIMGILGGAATGAAAGAAFGPAGIIPGAIIGAITGGVSDVSRASRADDAIIPPGYGNTVIKKGRDTIALNNNDTVVAGTNLGGGNNSEAKETNTLLRQILSKQGTIKLDSTDMGTAMSVNRYAIQ
jgi:hypothetical protein